jgi:hypothetical protein
VLEPRAGVGGAADEAEDFAVSGIISWTHRRCVFEASVPALGLPELRFGRGAPRHMISVEPDADSTTTVADG